MSRTAIATWLRRPIIVISTLFSGSYRQYVNVAHGLLTPTLGDRSPDGATNRLGNGIGVAPSSARQRLDCFQHRIVNRLLQEATITVALRNTDEIKRRILDQLAF